MSYWFEPSLLAEVRRILDSYTSDHIQRILVLGSEGMITHEMIEFIISQFSSNDYIIEYMDFCTTSFDKNEVILHSLQFHLNKNSKIFKSFLSSFSKQHRKNIRERIRSSSYFPQRSDWYEDLYLNFLFFISMKYRLSFIFENVDNIDGKHYLNLEDFLSSIQHIPHRIFFSMNPEGSFRHEINSSEEIILSRLSIQTVEKAIQHYYQTTPINARLITNHCYLKSEGLPLKIRLLLSFIYTPILKKGLNRFLNVKILQAIQISSNWEKLFEAVLENQEEKSRRLLAFLSRLAVPVLPSDLELILQELKIPTDQIQKWQRGGILHKTIFKQDSVYLIGIPLFSKWLRKRILLEEMNSLLETISELQISQKLKGIYPLSELLYEIDEIEKAIHSATIEANYFYEHKNLILAADRYYFLVRLIDAGLVKNQDIKTLLHQLAKVYFEIRSHENAFEMLKRLRSIYETERWQKKQINKKAWLRVNLQMVHSLIAMDAYQEARYILREIKVKEFCDIVTQGECHELLGEIEYNLSHLDYALTNYQKAITLYKQTKLFDRIYLLIIKLKSLLKENLKTYHQLIDKTLELISDNEEMEELKGLLLSERIGYLLKQEKYNTALQLCYQLWRIIQVFYEPKFRIRLAFYFAEIYTIFGKWTYAIERLKKINDDYYVIHRPSFHVKVLLQLALIYKDQALYGNARSLLEEAMNICFKYVFSKQLNEIKLHLGHIYLLVHSLVRSHEYLIEVYEWAKRSKDPEIGLLSCLYLSYYELQHERLDRSRKLLSEAKKYVNTSLNRMDYLNYLFYFSLWLLETRRNENALLVASLFIHKAKNLPRYITSGYYLSVRVHITRKEYSDARRYLNKGLKLVEKWRFPQLKYLLLCEKFRLHHLQFYHQKGKFKEQLREVWNYILEMADNIGDEILKNQFLESRFHDDIFKQYKKNILLKKK